jgi:hypothetical protein
LWHLWELWHLWTTSTATAWEANSTASYSDSAYSTSGLAELLQ